MPCPYKIILGRDTAVPCPLSSGVKIGSAGVEPAWGEL